MKKEFTILIADRNSNVREFLKREMMAAGYRVRLAENGKEVVKWTYRQEPLDLLILDPDLPDMEESDLMAKLSNRIPVLPIILHTYLSDHENHSTMLTRVAFVEKQGNSVERLKQVMASMLANAHTQAKTTNNLKLTES